MGLVTYVQMLGNSPGKPVRIVLVGSRVREDGSGDSRRDGGLCAESPVRAESPAGAESPACAEPR